MLSRVDEDREEYEAWAQSTKKSMHFGGFGLRHQHARQSIRKNERGARGEITTRSHEEGDRGRHGELSDSRTSIGYSYLQHHGAGAEVGSLAEKQRLLRES